MTSSRSSRIGSSDLTVFPLALGGNVFGWTADEQQSYAVLDAFTAAGGDFVDTADVYSTWAPGNQGGESETIIGAWMAARGNRDSVVVATKVGAHPDYRGLEGANITAATEQSLRRLGTDRIDLLYTHYDDVDTPIEEIVTALDGLVRSGKVRHVAASNISADRLTAALEFAQREGLAPYVAVQPLYNLVARDAYEGELAAVATRFGLSAIPYYGLAAGFLTGKYRVGGPAVDSPRADGAGKYLRTPRGPKVLEALDSVAADHRAEPATVALAWLAAQPTVAAPIASARTLEQLPALLAFPELELSADQLALLDAASR
ncbi:aldo/keto reductase [Streptacidiphilus sp. PB12-B1b]|uniref:aldo/keto reductase n=1 Tax=Streptacidiphilus sp. PB12-B1b TaxID=2705012 RepID=UPI0015FAF9A7|nr:aldo/keto reductase [Streptacidiphilus sp. PB12-B1b]QMU74534.1 aldo/keto reductase [Streptacidiphilus sp. PB12-B1b]